MHASRRKCSDRRHVEYFLTSRRGTNVVGDDHEDRRGVHRISDTASAAGKETSDFGERV